MDADATRNIHPPPSRSVLGDEHGSISAGRQVLGDERASMSEER